MNPTQLSEWKRARLNELLKTRSVDEMLEASQAFTSLQGDVQRELDKYSGGLTLEECVELCNAVAWNNRDAGWGISVKNGGERANRYDGKSCATDILHHQPTGIVVDCLGGAGEGLRPSAVWIVHGVNTQRDRPWLAPIVPEHHVPVEPDKPPPVIPVLHLDRQEFYDEMIYLDWFYRADIGLRRPTGLASENGTPDFTGIAAWIFDIYLNNRLAGKSKSKAREAYEAEIRKSDEWRGKHGIT